MERLLLCGLSIVNVYEWLLFLPEDLTSQGIYLFHKLILIGRVVETEAVKVVITKLVAVA